MDVEPSHSAAGAAAPASSAPSQPMDVDSSSGSARLRTQLKTIAVSQKGASTSAEGVLRHLLKMLSALKKSPNLLATRKFRADNIAVKKFVIDVPGALDICKYVGYQSVELTDKKVPYLIIEEAAVAQPDNQAKLDEAIEAVSNAVAVFDAPAGSAAAAAASSKPADAVKKLCEGGCGFFGSADTEGYCSVCFKKKFLAGAGPISPAKPVVHNNPFVTPPKGATTVQPSAASAAAPSAAAAASSLSLAAGSSSGEAKCLKNCGRFGSKATKGFCQPCFDRLTAQGQKAPPKRWKCLFDGAIVKLRAVHRFNLGKKPVQIHKNRCWTCQKKVGITGFECRCRYIFCGQHRYMEQHECSYDIKSLHRKKLKRENEEIRAAKILKL